MPSQPMRTTTAVAVAAAALLDVLHPMRGAAPARRPARPARRARRSARRDAAGNCDRRRRPTRSSSSTTKPQLVDVTKQRRRPEAQGPVPTLVLPGDTLDDAPHMALAVAASFLASLMGRDPQRRLRHKDDDPRGRRDGLRRRRALQRRLPLGHGQLWKSGDARLRAGLRGLPGPPRRAVDDHAPLDFQ